VVGPGRQRWDQGGGGGGGGGGPAWGLIFFVL
jgi:hypothetical protein